MENFMENFIFYAVESIFNVEVMDITVVEFR